MTSAPSLVFGTAQLTTRYGVTNGRPSEPSEDESFALLAAAWAAGLRTVDTAPVYGDSERVIGSAEQEFRVHTKTHTGLGVRESFEASRRRLGSHPIDVLFLHDPDEVLRPNGATLTEARDVLQGTEVRLGASIYEVRQFQAALQDPSIAVVQVPGNLLDRRFTGVALEQAARAGTQVVLRSVLLQGTLAVDPHHLPAAVDHLAPAVRNLAEIASAYGHRPIELALGWIRHLVGVESVVLGVSTLAELDELLAAWIDLDADVLAALHDLELPDPEACDPRRWVTRS
jgi:aryl-alcohol dehydrogenase-like predicted oxidoreductase